MLNIAVINGRVASKELKNSSTNQENTYLYFQVAVPHNTKKEDGTRDADFLPVKAWGKVADNMINILKQGDLLEVTGRMKSNLFTDKDGKTQRDSYIAVTTFTKLADKRVVDTTKEDANDSNLDIDALVE